MYSFHRDYRGGCFESGITGEKFTFKQDRDKTDQRRAQAEMEDHHREIKAAAESRAGRSLSIRELVRGDFLLDTRTLREKVQEDAVVQLNTDPQTEKNPHDSWLAEIEKMPDGPRKDRRLVVAREEQTKWNTKRDEEQAFVTKLADPDRKDAIVDANALHTLLSVNHEVPQDWVNEAKSRRDSLADGSLDPEAYWKAVDEFEEVQTEWKDSKKEALQLQIDDLSEQQEQVDEPATETPVEDSGAQES